MSKKNKKQNLSQTVICPNCGEKYNSDHKYCPYCRKDPYGNTDGYSPISDKKAQTIRIVAGVVLVVVFVALYLILK